MKNSYKRSFIKIVLLGFALGLFIASMLIHNVSFPKLSWGPNWYIKPMLVLSFVASIGSIPFYFANQYEASNHSKKILAYLGATLFLLFFIWIGIILGFDGTIWN